MIGCCHDAEVFDSASGRSYGRFTEIYNGRRGVRDGGIELLLDPGYMMLPSTMMVRSSAVGDLRFDPRIRVANDWLFDIELFRHGRIVGLDDVLARIDATSTTRRPRRPTRWRTRCRAGRRGRTVPGASRAIRRRRVVHDLRRGEPALARRRPARGAPLHRRGAGTGRVLPSFWVALRLLRVESAAAGSASPFPAESQHDHIDSFP